MVKSTQKEDNSGGANDLPESTVPYSGSADGKRLC